MSGRAADDPKYAGKTVFTAGTNEGAQAYRGLAL